MAILRLQTRLALAIMYSRHTPHMTSSERPSSHTKHWALTQYGQQTLCWTLHHDVPVNISP